jgi:hypothetical protein
MVQHGSCGEKEEDTRPGIGNECGWMDTCLNREGVDG